MAEVETRMLEAVYGEVGWVRRSRFVARTGDFWLDGDALGNQAKIAARGIREESCWRFILKKAVEENACC